MPAPRFVPPSSQSTLSPGTWIPTQRQAPPPELEARAAPPAPRPARSDRRRTVAVLLIALGTSAGLLVGLIVGSVASGPSTTAQAGATSVPAGGGRYRVGPDLAPGIYQTSGENGSSATGCYYARLKTGDGSLDDIIDNYVAQGPMTVAVGQSDGYFETTGCSPWTKIG